MHVADQALSTRSEKEQEIYIAQQRLASIYVKLERLLPNGTSLSDLQQVIANLITCRDEQSATEAEIFAGKGEVSF